MTVEGEFTPRTVLVTGGAGFIGSNMVRWILERTDARVVNLDLLTYAGNVESLTDVFLTYGPEGEDRYAFVHGDIVGETAGALLSGRHPCCEDWPRIDAVIHLAAESHVDRSILGPAPFVRTNVEGTLCLLEAARASLDEDPRPFRFLHVSTDEVYGSLTEEDPAFTEETPLRPNSPYSASKAASDLLVRAFVVTYGLPALVTRCSNNYGPYQFPEKLIPLMITRALEDQPLPVYGDGKHRRDWIHVLDHVEGLWRVLRSGRVGEVYNLGGRRDVPNLRIVRRILSILGKPESLVTFVPDRPGHD
ncbi:MAG TPA: dTDP-glucose 4,6-dehydratase, partial [Longimicrobiales bacterium]|nr:dTDP-glucose 4,6-dehydratase [Longimicrobiales bacterium]